MSSVMIGSTVFACLIGGALLSSVLKAALPAHHLVADSKEAIKAGMGLVATMAALVLGLLVASAQESYKVQSNELTEMSARIVMLDRVLAHYGPETREERDQVRMFATRILDQAWSNDRNNASRSNPRLAGGEALYENLQELSPKDDRQRAIQAQALTMAISLGQMRWLMFEQGATVVSMPLVIVLTFWLTALFVSFGLFAPFNATVIASFVISALSVSGAIVLIIEMYTPYAGIIRISSAPLRAALAQLGS